MNSNVKHLEHVAQPPLHIEREMAGGREYIIVEGVRYDAGYFLAFAHPETDVLYAVRRDGDQVWLTVIQTQEEAIEFFEEVGQGDPAPTEDDQDGI